ncbi:MAG: aminoacyl-tRNA hydrolase [Candidatus Paceibacterota bacterium]
MANKFKSKEIKLIIGLGNPGDKYKNTYHNVGIEFVKLLKKRMIPPYTKNIYESQCFMNQSGLCAKKELQKHNISREELLIVHDDSDITIGEYKFSFEKGSAGHRGIKSIIENIGGKDFWRLRIGIRAKDEKTKAGSFVLKQINKDDQLTLQEVFEELISITSE